ncbi:MAG: TlpA family protein disulfide reductase [Armatimonadetes bacterium]|nr:TlpA family protein disulfide reductase [Armatimonadota bacterium]MDW8122013.1 TlpA disulfide reductase family protein [Armatimonadota bacterium]
MTAYKRWAVFLSLLTGSLAVAALPRGKSIPAFSALLVDKRTIRVTTEGGRLRLDIMGADKRETVHPKVLVLDFWATWCSYCRVAEGWLQKLYKRYGKKGLEVLAISIDEDGRRSVGPYLLRHRLPYRVALDPRAVLANKFKVESLPTIYVIDAKGTIRSVFEGIENEKSLIREVVAAGLE